MNFFLVWHWFGRRSRFVLAPLVDGWEGISLTRLLAIYGATLVGETVRSSPTHSLNANAVVVLVVCIAAAFGKTTFVFFLQRYQARSEGAESLALTGNVADIVKAVAARRATGSVDESEPTP